MLKTNKMKSNQKISIEVTGNMVFIYLDGDCYQCTDEQPVSFIKELFNKYALSILTTNLKRIEENDLPF